MLCDVVCLYSVALAALTYIWYKFSMVRKLFCLLTQHIITWFSDYALSIKIKILLSAFLEIAQNSNFILSSALCLYKHVAILDKQICSYS